MSEKSILRAAQRSSVQGDRPDGSRGSLVPERNEAAATPLLKGHRRDNRHSQTRTHHAQNAAELAAFKNDLWLQPGAFARRHGRFAEAMTVTQQEKRIVVQISKKNGAALCQRMLSRQHRIEFFLGQRE